MVAALLPMLFVSGLMGPYMSPIPANASAAMTFSFFVAEIIAPWLILRIAGWTDMAEHAGNDVHGGHHGGSGWKRPIPPPPGPRSSRPCWPRSMGRMQPPTGLWQH